MSKIIGIDLGTTNCCVATVVDGKPWVLEDERGFRTMPSYLTIEGGKFVVGRPAKTQVITNPYHTVFAVKRLIGRAYNSDKVALAKEQFAYNIEQASDGGVLVRIDDRKFTPVEVSSIFLKSMRDIAANHLGADIRDAIVTVPAYFNDNQRKQTKAAAEIGGLNVLRLVNEPTAAALAYGFGREMDKKIVVFDLGGGTLDISILEIVGNVFEVIATHGDTYLGGEDFDLRIVDYLIGEFQKNNNIDLRVDKMALQRLKDAAERAKIELSEQENTRINLAGISQDADLDIVLGKDDMEILVQDLVDKCISICQQVLGESGLTKNQVDDVVLVGGMTRMPLVHKAVSDFFGVQPRKDVHPDEAIAIGAAILANSLDKIEEQTLLLDVTPLSLGIDSIGDIFSVLIPKNTTVPTSVTQTFTTVVDNQERVTIHVRQGESKKASENSLLGSFTLEGIRPAKKMAPQIEVAFHIDLDGILSVSAKDLDTGKEQKIVIQNYLEAPRAAAEETQTAVLGDVKADKPVDEMLEEPNAAGAGDEPPHVSPSSPPSPFSSGSPNSPPPPFSTSDPSTPPPSPFAAGDSSAPPPSPFASPPTSTQANDPDATAVNDPDVTAVNDPDVTAVNDPDVTAVNDPDATAVTGQTNLPVLKPGAEPVKQQPLRLRVRYPDAESFSREYETNIAPGEGFVETEKPFKVGTELIIETLIGANPEPIRIMGVVAWVNRVKPQSPDDPPQGMQIRYNINREDIERRLAEMS